MFCSSGFYGLIVTINFGVVEVPWEHKWKKWQKRVSFLQLFGFQKNKKTKKIFFFENAAVFFGPKFYFRMLTRPGCRTKILKYLIFRETGMQRIFRTKILFSHANETELQNHFFNVNIALFQNPFRNTPSKCIIFATLKGFAKVGKSENFLFFHVYCIISNFGK